MIDGLKIEMTSDDLQDHLRERYEYHSERSREYKEQAGSVQNIQMKDNGAVGYSNSPVQSLAGSAEEHRRKSVYFLFLADNIIKGETYRLSERDLEQIGISAQRGW